MTTEWDPTGTPSSDFALSFPSGKYAHVIVRLAEPSAEVRVRAA
ncbi:hypothetical protein ACFVDI_21100 [Nocardioides sp. NPDC057767]